MSRTVTALYSSREEAERAFRALTANVSLAHAEIYDRTPQSAAALQRFEATAEERAHFERQLAGGEYMLLAQVHTGEDPARIVAILNQVAQEAAVHQGSAPRAAAPPDFRPPPQAANIGTDLAAGAVEEERLPVVEEELRIGTQEVVRGGARVRTHVEEVPVQQDVELIEEVARIDRRPVMRPISDADLESGGLLRERVIEITQMREEPVVTRQAFVREEVVVTKSIERRVERIEDTVRRTDVEVNEFRGDPATAAPAGAEPSAFSGFDQARDPTR
jgi:stress response protein YsnF